ncbi:MAG TPA: mRNA interferase MqsR [Pseudomonas sp.]|nr:type II toxin-antitoxin system MqsR family toxin [Pseudomonas putida]HBK49975.1 mRNA interferase MqsR [Pseudomonas sp.]
MSHGKENASLPAGAGKSTGGRWQEVITGLERRDFYKSMTSYADHRVWQDVYRPLTVKGYLYLKLSVVDDALIVSFKEL